MPFAIDACHLNKTFVSRGRGHRRILALDDVSLKIPYGEIFGILGPNGAGKTTLLNVLATLLLPDSGTVSILGIPSTPRNARRLRALLNMSSGYPNFPWCLTVEENLLFYGRLYGLPRRVLQRRVAESIEVLELGRFAKVPFDELSSGTKQKLSLAKALLNQPRIIFLDEPTVGLDPHIAAKLRETIVHIQRQTGITVLLTTHNMPEAEALCRRIAFIKDGRILKVAPPEELKQIYHRQSLEQIFIDLVNPSTPSSLKGGARSGLTLRSALGADERVKVQTAGVPEGTPAASSGEPAAGAAPIGEGVSLRSDFYGDIRAWGERCFAFFQRNFLFGVRNFFTFMELLFWPTVSLISIGLLGDFLQIRENALAFVLTGAITAGVLQVTQLDVAYGFLYEVWSKSMKQTMLTPVGVTESLFGSWANGILRGAAIFVVLGLSAMALFGFAFPPPAVTAIFLSGIFACALLLGILVNVLLLVFGNKAEVTAWMFAYLFMLLSGIYYPITTLPPFFYHLAQWVPITYFLEYFRHYFGFTPQLSYALLKGTILVVVYFWLELIVLRLALHRARKKGIILRLSE